MSTNFNVVSLKEKIRDLTESLVDNIIKFDDYEGLEDLEIEEIEHKYILEKIFNYVFYSEDFPQPWRIIQRIMKNENHTKELFLKCYYSIYRKECIHSKYMNKEYLIGFSKDEFLASTLNDRLLNSICLHKELTIEVLLNILENVTSDDLRKRICSEIKKIVRKESN